MLCTNIHRVMYRECQCIYLTHSNENTAVNVSVYKLIFCVSYCTIMYVDVQVALGLEAMTRDGHAILSICIPQCCFTQV